MQGCKIVTVVTCPGVTGRDQLYENFFIGLGKAQWQLCAVEVLGLISKVLETKQIAKQTNRKEEKVITVA